jgi:Short C-terminal domain
MVAARILVVLGVLFVVLSLLAGYVRYQGLDTDTVSDTAGDLVADDEIREQLALSMVDQLYANVDVAAELEARLPEEQKGLAGPAAAGLREFSERAANGLLERPRVQALWVSTVTRAHGQLIDVLEDDTGPLSTEGGAVVLDLQPLVIQLGERVAVVGDVAERFGPDAGRIEIMEAEELETAQDLTQVLKFLGSWLWLLPLALWAGALWLARGRRLSILRLIGFGAIFAGFLVLVVRRLGGSFIVEELAPTTAIEPAAQNAWDILTSLLRDGGFTLVGLGVIVLLAVWLAGPSPSGLAARQGLAPYLARPEIAYGVAAGLFLLLLWWSPTVQTTRVPLMVAAALIFAVGVELLRRQTAREHPNPPPPDPVGSVRRGLDRVRGQTPEQERLAALDRLGRLRAQGVLTDEEFAAEKAQLVRQ